MAAEFITPEDPAENQDLSQETVEALLSELDAGHLRQLLDSIAPFLPDEDLEFEVQPEDLSLVRNDEDDENSDDTPIADWSDDAPEDTTSPERMTAEILEILQDTRLNRDLKALLRGIVEVAVLDQRRVNTRRAPDTVDLSQKQREKLQQLRSDQAEILSGLENPFIIEDIKAAVSAIRERIEQIFDPTIIELERPDKDPIFVVGGKSRALTEFLLSLAIGELPDGHPARTAFTERLRLSDTINKRLYDNFTSRQTLDLPPRTVDTSEDLQEGSDEPLVPFLDIHEFLSSVRGNYVIMVEDFMETGMKVERTLSKFKKSGITGEYLVFFGPSLTDSELEVIIEQNFILNKHLGLITVGGRETRSWELIKMLSEYISAYVDIGRNQVLAGQVYSFSDLDPEVKDSLRTHEIALKLKRALLSE